jgi:hypothetical protein
MGCFTHDDIVDLLRRRGSMWAHEVTLWIVMRALRLEFRVDRVGAGRSLG